MIVLEWLFDIILCFTLIFIAGGALYTRSLYTGVVLFITFGLLLALTWARLGSADLALAEAALGAGLTGVLLLSALSQLPKERRPEPLWLAGRDWPALVFVLLTFILLVKAVWPVADSISPLPEAVASQLSSSGVSHPVTAVLLNFRAWDTLLELAVLLLALAGVKQLLPPVNTYPTPWRLLSSWSKALAPLTVVVGGYVLWRGSSAPGGAFQAGALLAAGGVMLRLNKLLPPLHWQQLWVRVLVLAGLSVFVLIAAGTAWLGDGWLYLPSDWNTLLIVTIELVATVSIATTLTVLVVGEKEEART